MHELLGLPEHQRVVYDRAPLVLVVCQVQFTRVLGLGDAAFVAPFQRAIQAEYPVLNEQKSLHLEVSFVEGQVVPPRQEQRPSAWQFSDPNGDWNIVLAQESLGIETRSYSRFEDFIARIERLLDALTEFIRPALLTRIGLRYIDEIRGSELTWAEIIRPEALGLLQMSVPTGIRDNVQKAVQEYRLLFSPTEGLTLRYGQLSTGSVVQPKQGQPLATDPFYFLDIDAFQVFAAPSAVPVRKDLILPVLDDYHTAIHKLFRWFVTPEYLATLGEHNEPNS